MLCFTVTIKMSRQGQDCNVCCDDKIDFISCLHCAEKACSGCYEKFLLDHPLAVCMFCKKEWNHEFLQTNFRKGFIDGKYKDHKKKVIFEREKALFPQTQEKIEKDKTKDRLMKMIEEKRKQMRKLKEEINSLQLDLYRIDRNTEEKEEKKEEKDEEKRVSTIFCATKDCRGFLNNRYICGICETSHCKDCRVALRDEEKHECDKNTLETIKMLKKDTKPCPKCSTPIFKIEGCDQMWCTQCHTAFSWKHGRIETGHVHNPHYWQYLQKQGRDIDAVRRMERGENVGNNRCVELRDVGHVIKHAGFSELCRIFTHIGFYDLPEIVVPNYVESNHDIRKKFMLNEIDEKHFKKLLHMREKKALFTAEKRQIIQMFHDVGKDILLKAYRMYSTDTRGFNNNNKMSDIYKEMKELGDYTMTQIKEVAERFSYSVENDIRLMGALRQVIKIVNDEQEKHVKYLPVFR